MADKDTKQEEKVAEVSTNEGEAKSDSDVHEPDQAGSEQGEEAELENQAHTSKPSQEPAKPNKPVEDTERSRSVSANLEKIIEQIEKLSVLELSDLVHGLEDRFGVSAQAPIAATGAAASAESSGEPQEEKTTFNVILSESGANKISAIKAVRELVPTLGLKEAKDLVEAAPKVVLEGVGKEAAEAAKKKLEEAGATAELQ